jgi:AraC-like DNA-binding protein
MQAEKPFSYTDLAESKEWEEFYKSFYELTKLPLGMLNPDFTQTKYFCPEEAMHAICRVIRASSKGRAACMATDKLKCNIAAREKHGIRYYCHAGLVDFAVPVIIEGRHIASIMCGQMLPEPPSEKGFQKIWQKVKNLDIDKKALHEAYFQCPFMPEEQLASLLKVISIFADYFCEMGRRLFFSEAYFSRLFSKIEGVTFTHYLQRIRLGEAKKLLEKSDLSITQVAFAAGFNNLSYFNELFHKSENCTPSEYRKQHKS